MADPLQQHPQNIAGAFSGRSLFENIPLLQALVSLLSPGPQPPPAPPPMIASPEMMQGVPGAQPMANPRAMPQRGLMERMMMQRDR